MNTYYIIVDYGFMWQKKYKIEDALKQQQIYRKSGINSIIIAEEDLKQIHAY